MKRSHVVALCALLFVAVALSAEDKQAPFAPVPPADPYIVPSNSPYYVPGAGTPGEGPRVGHVGDPGDAVAPDELGKKEGGDAALAAFLLGYIVGQQPADESSGTQRRAPSHIVTRGPRSLPAFDYEDSHARFQAWLLAGKSGLPGRIEQASPAPTQAQVAAPPAALPARPHRPLAPAVASWLVAYRPEESKLLAAADRAASEKTEAGCQALGAAVDAAHIPRAPAPDLESSASSALSWLARAVASCKGGFRDATALRIDRARDAFASVDSALGL